MGAVPLSVDAFAKLLNELIMTPELHAETFPNDDRYEFFLINLIKALDTSVGIKLDHLTKHSSDTTLCEITEYCLWLSASSSDTRSHLQSHSIQSNSQYSDLVEDSLSRISARVEN
jgi:hypothetical protein